MMRTRNTNVDLCLHLLITLLVVTCFFVICPMRLILLNDKIKITNFQQGLLILKYLN